jgi:hypothetical protein
VSAEGSGVVGFAVNPDENAEARYQHLLKLCEVSQYVRALAGDGEVFTTVFFSEKEAASTGTATDRILLLSLSFHRFGVGLIPFIVGNVDSCGQRPSMTYFATSHLKAC